MLMQSYQRIFITNLPSFYKINLFNEVAKRKRVLVVFTGEKHDNRNADFYKGEKQFDVQWLTGGAMAQCRQMAALLRHTAYDRLVISGWDRPVVLLAAWLSPKSKNACIVESSIYESATTGLKAQVKRCFLKRISQAYPSGKLQNELVRALGYKGRSVQWGGCGILNYQSQPAYAPRQTVTKFLYVGRLSPEKNLKLLLEAFRDMPELSLTMVGFGPQTDELRALAPANVHFTGAVDNDKLPGVYQSHDVFILPSISEPWGLVVEEALNNGTPVIVSDRVGCKDDLVTADTGLVFRHDSVNALREAVRQITQPEFYNHLRQGVSKLNFTERAQRQVKAFTD